MKISAVVLTKNEEKNIERCLKSIEFCDEIVIVDDNSDDNTIKKILNLKLQNPNESKIKIYKRKLNGDFADQRNFGMTKVKNKWILFIDADEEVSEDLKKSILKLVLDDIDGYYLQRRDFFWNNELKYGETKKVRNDGLLRLVKKNSGKWLGNVHEIFHTANNTGKLVGFINHYPHRTLKDFIRKINFYSTLRSKELFNLEKKTNILEIIIWPLGKFTFNYFINLGFLDGPPGFVYAFLMSFHSFLVRAKLYQLQTENFK